MFRCFIVSEIWIKGLQKITRSQHYGVFILETVIYWKKTEKHNLKTREGGKGLYKIY